jgi:DNA-binding CsgD family transcriptional regulator
MVIETTPKPRNPHRKTRKDGRAFNAGSARSLLARQREVTILQLRLQGLSYDDIAAKIKLNVSSVFNVVTKLLDRYDEELKLLIPQARNQEIERCREIIKCMWPRMKKGDSKAAAVVLKTSERLSRLSGLDAPIEVDAKVKGGLTIESFRELIAAETPDCPLPNN